MPQFNTLHCTLLSTVYAISASLLLLSMTPMQAEAQMPPNIGFSMGNFTNWTCWVGIATTGTPATGTYFDSGKISAPIGGNAPGWGAVNESRHFITSGSDTDYYGGFPIVAPSGGTYSLRIGNDSFHCRADRVQYFIHVPPGTTSFNLQCKYAIVLEDPSHLPEEQPTFQVVAYDSATGTVLPAANNLYIAHYAVPGFLFTRAPVQPGFDSFVYYLPWTTTTINLSGMGGKTVTLECTALDCSQTGHFCYGYFDVVSAADSLAASIVSYNAVGDSVVLQGPPGYKTYQWFDQNFSQALNAATDTAKTKTLPTPMTQQYYNLIITPYATIGLPDTIRTPVLKANPLGVSAALLASVRTYPNPALTTLHVVLPSSFDGTISLWNAAGQRVYSATVSGATMHDIPTGSIAAGVYTLLLKDDNGEVLKLKVAIRH